MQTLLCITAVAGYRDEKSLPREALNISMSPFAPENLGSRDGIGSDASCSSAYLRLNLWFTYGILHDFRGGVDLFIETAMYAIGPVPSLSCHAIFRTDGVHCQESAGSGPVNPKGSSKRVLP